VEPFTVLKKAEKGIFRFQARRVWRFKQEDIVKWIEQKRNGR